MKHKKLAVHFQISLLILLVTCHLSLVTFSYAQDDFSDPGSQDTSSEVSSNDAPVDQSSSVDQSVSDSGTGLSEQSRDSWATDPNFNDANNSDTSDDGGGLTPGSHDSWATDPNFDAADNLNQAAYAESQAYQNLYSYEAEHGMDGSAEHQALQEAAGAASAATQVAEGAFESVNAEAVSETTTVGQAGDQLAQAFSPEAMANVAPEDYPSYAQNALGQLPGEFHAGERAAAIGASGLDPEAAASLAGWDAAGRGEGPGGVMGASQVAFATAGGNNVTSLDNVQTAINVAAGTGVPIDTPEFASAAFATGNTWGVSPFDVQTELTNLGVSQDNIISGAVAQRTDPGEAFTNPNTIASAQTQAATARSDAAAAGPTNATSAPTTSAPAGAPQPAPAPAPPPAPPAPEPEPAANVGSQNQEPSIVGGTQYNAPVTDSKDANGWTKTTAIAPETPTQTAQSITVSTNGRESAVNVTSVRGEEVYEHVNAVPTDNDLKSAAAMNDFAIRNIK